MGAVGSTGATGARGEEGDRGFHSTTAGPQGEDGPKGDQGNGGDTGPTGADGDQGETGVIGPRGPEVSCTSSTETTCATIAQLEAAIGKIKSGDTIVGKAWRCGELVAYSTDEGDWRWDLPQRIWLEANGGLNWHLHPDPTDPAVVHSRYLYKAGLGNPSMEYGQSFVFGSGTTTDRGTLGYGGERVAERRPRMQLWDPDKWEGVVDYDDWVVMGRPEARPYSGSDITFTHGRIGERGGLGQAWRLGAGTLGYRTDRPQLWTAVKPPDPALGFAGLCSGDSSFTPPESFGCETGKVACRVTEGTTHTWTCHETLDECRLEGETPAVDASGEEIPTPGGGAQLSRYNADFACVVP